MLGTIINVAAILVGGFLGLIFRKGLPERISTTITHGLSLGIMMLGISMGVQTQNFLIVLISLALGAVIGEALNIEGHLNSLGGRLERKFEGGENSSFAQGFVTASLLYCTGSMAIMGAIEGGISGTYTILVTKALLDGIFAIIFASTMGVGVLFAAVPVLLYQGGRRHNQGLFNRSDDHRDERRRRRAHHGYWHQPAGDQITPSRQFDPCYLYTHFAALSHELLRIFFIK